MSAHTGTDATHAAAPLRDFPQAKLRIGPVDDPLEREADRIADAVVADRPIGPMGSAASNTAQRKCAECEKEVATVRTKSASGKARRPHAAPAIVGQALRAPGAPLTPEQLAYFEPRFGHDFSDVRLHTSGEARQAARGIGARAYTHGRDIAFAKGEYSPGLLAHELTHVVQQRGGHETIQRQPDDQAEIEMPPQWAFAVPGRAGDVGYARSLGKADAKRLRKAGTLSAADRAEINAKLDFFLGSAFDAYAREVKPALIEVTREEIDMGAEEKKAAPAADPMATGFDRFREFPTYIDNEITRVEYFTAELAIIHYKDGTKYELGLTAQWMKPPVVHVDYGTPRHLLHPFTSANKEARFFREGDKVPHTASFEEIRTKYSTEVKYYIEKGTGRIVPSHINMLTAPTLCGVLLDSFKQYLENVDMAVQIGLGGTAAIGGYAGAGGIPKNVGVGLGTTTSRRILGSAVAKTVPAEVNATLKALGVTEHDLAVFAQGQKVFGHIQRGAIEFTPYFIREGDTFVAGVLSAYSKSKTTSMDMIKALLTFRQSSMAMAKSMGAKTLRLEADVVVNTTGLVGELLKRGFKLVDPSSAKYVLEIAL